MLRPYFQKFLSLKYTEKQNGPQDKKVLSAMVGLIKDLVAVQDNLSFPPTMIRRALTLIGEENNKSWCVIESKLEEWVSQHSKRLMQVLRHAQQMRVKGDKAPEWWKLLGVGAATKRSEPAQAGASNVRQPREKEGSWHQEFDADLVKAWRVWQTRRKRDTQKEYSEEFTNMSDDEHDEDATTMVKVRWADKTETELDITVHELREHHKRRHESLKAIGSKIAPFWEGETSNGLIKLRVKLLPQKGRPILAALEDVNEKSILTTRSAPTKDDDGTKAAEFMRALS